MATSAIRNATRRPRLTTSAPILISFSFKLVSDQKGRELLDILTGLASFEGCALRSTVVPYS
jgi:hypothetical protein